MNLFKCYAAWHYTVQAGIASTAYHPEWFQVHASKHFQNTNNIITLLYMFFTSLHLNSTKHLKVLLHINDIFVCNTNMIS